MHYCLRMRQWVAGSLATLGGAALLFARMEAQGAARGTDDQQCSGSGPIAAVTACTALIEAANGAASVKTGAEGAYVAVLGELGLGVALKIDDGAGRASETVITAILAALGVIDRGHPAIAALVDAKVVDTTGRVVGARRPSAWLTSELRQVAAI